MRPSTSSKAKGAKGVTWLYGEPRIAHQRQCQQPCRDLSPSVKKQKLAGFGKLQKIQKVMAGLTELMLIDGVTNITSGKSLPGGK
jgi:hypothetical protein